MATVHSKFAFHDPRREQLEFYARVQLTEENKWCYSKAYGSGSFCRGSGSYCNSSGPKKAGVPNVCAVCSLLEGGFSTVSE